MRLIPINAKSSSIFGRNYSNNFERNMLKRRDYPIIPLKNREPSYFEFCSKTVLKIRYQICDKQRKKNLEWELPFKVQCVDVWFDFKMDKIKGRNKFCCNIKKES